MGGAGVAAGLWALKVGCPWPGARCDAAPDSSSAWLWAGEQCGLWHREWRADWDGRAPPPPGASGEKMKTQGRIRHLFFIRHGQYDLESEDHGLTELGREQSRLLARRLKEMADQVQRESPTKTFSITFSGIWSSDVLRARQTAEIIAEHLPGVTRFPPDPVLAEGQPAVPCPHRKPGEVRASSLWEDSARIEYAFRRYVHRDVDHKRLAEEEKRERKKAKQKDMEGQAPEAEHKKSAELAALSSSTSAETGEHTFEIIVCHCNVIRYFVMRALQLPPEAWLRLGGFNCGITEVVVRPNGAVSLVRFGDTGHLSVAQTTFH